MVLKIVKADQSHSRNIWKWRNNPITRSVSRKTDKVEWKDHEAWFRKCLDNNKIFLYIGIDKNSQKDIPIGIIRFNLLDLSHKDYEVSINIEPNFRKKGFGHCLLKNGTKKFIEDINKSIRIYALVKVDNVPSIKLFTAAGYSLCDIDDNGFAKYFIDFQ